VLKDWNKEQTQRSVKCFKCC